MLVRVARVDAVEGNHHAVLTGSRGGGRCIHYSEMRRPPNCQFWDYHFSRTTLRSADYAEDPTGGTHMIRSEWLATLVLGTLLVSCTPAGTTSTPSAGGARQSTDANPQRTLVGAIRLEPVSLSLRPPLETLSIVDH